MGSYTLVVAPMGVKFPLLHAKFHPHRRNDEDVGSPKLKFLLRFDQNAEYKRHAGVYPLRDFHNICRVCTAFQDALAVKIWLDLLEGLWSYGGFKLRGLVSPDFQCPQRRNCASDPQKFSRCKNVLEVLYHHAKFGWAWISHAAGWPKTLSIICLSVLFVCLFITLLNVRDCAPDFAMKALEHRNNFDAAG